MASADHTALVELPLQALPLAPAWLTWIDLPFRPASQASLSHVCSQHPHSPAVLDDVGMRFFKKLSVSRGKGGRGAYPGGAAYTGGALFQDSVHCFQKWIGSLLLFLSWYLIIAEVVHLELQLDPDRYLLYSCNSIYGL